MLLEMNLGKWKIMKKWLKLGKKWLTICESISTLNFFGWVHYEQSEDVTCNKSKNAFSIKIQFFINFQKQDNRRVNTTPRQHDNKREGMFSLLYSALNTLFRKKNIWWKVQSVNNTKENILEICESPWVQDFQIYCINNVFLNLTLWHLVSTVRSYTLKQTWHFQFLVCLRMYELLVYISR